MWREARSAPEVFIGMNPGLLKGKHPEMYGTALLDGANQASLKRTQY